MTLKRQLLAIATNFALTTVGAPASIIGSPHDFSAKSWNSAQGVCTPCHTGHSASAGPPTPIWGHATTTKSYTTYTSPSMRATDAGHQPNTASKACLSCHDGTVANNSEFKDSASGAPVLGPNIDLSMSHPVSITYDNALAARTGSIFPPSSTLLQWASDPRLAGKSIAQALLKGPNHDKLECTSCHDPHAQTGGASADHGLLAITGKDANGRGDLLCRTCHKM